MKEKKLHLAGIALLFLFLFYAIKGINSEENNTEQVFIPGKKFLVTAMHCGFHPTNPCATEFSSYNLLRDTLRFNGWHRYGCWFSGDVVFGDSSTIAQGIANTMSENNQYDLRTIFDRPIIRYLAYGQSSDYQCEQIAIGNDYYFHAYDTSITNTYLSDINDSYFNGGGAKVKFCSTIPSGPGIWSGYVVKSLRSNREQCNRIIDHTRDDTYKWYVKPRIRIDTAFANNASNGQTNVCRVDIVDWDGNTVKEVILKARNFRNGSNRYNGNYIEDFFFSSTDSNFTLQPTQLCPSPIKNAFNWDDDIRTDFRVYWYGNCEMYIDYVRVENEPAKELFDPLNSNHNYLTNRLVSEINLAGSNYNSSDPMPNNFYNEEFEFNMTPCTQRLSKIIDSVSQGKLTFMVNLNMEMYNVHIPRYWEKHILKASEFKKYLLDSSRIKIVLPTAYNLEGWDTTHPGHESYNPITLPLYSAYPSIDYDSVHGVLTYKTTPSKYDKWLQYNFDDNPNYYYKYTTIMKIMDTLTKIADVQRIDLHQSHLWNQYSHKLKEPTNEELVLTANLDISYGAKGLMYFAYNGVCDGNGYSTTYTPSGDPPAYSAGFVDKNKDISDINTYGQNKWSFYKRYDRLLEKWGPYIMSFDNANRKSFIYRKSAERDAMSSITFIDRLNTYLPVSFAPPDPDPELESFSLDPADSVFLGQVIFSL